MADTVLITGASGGIGYELSKLFAANGDNLILIARNGNKLELFKTELEKQHRISVMVIAKDLSENGAVPEVFNKVSAAGWTADILVNNAGFGDFGSFSSCDWNKQHAMVQLNILALMQMTKLFLPGMVKNRKGKILNIASIAAFQPGPYMATYYASKAFVLSFSEALATELKKSGVTVTAVCPGPTKTGFSEAADLGSSKLFSSLKNATAEEVAAFSYKALMKGKPVAIPGLMNRVLVFGQRFLPRSAVRAMVARIQGNA